MFGDMSWAELLPLIEYGVLYELAEGLFGNARQSFPTFQVRDRGLLESAIALPRQGFIEGFSMKLAAMVRSVAENHALADGNKRLAVAVLHATLLVNDFGFTWSDRDAATLIERCAKKEIEREGIAAFIDAWTFPLQLDDDERVPLEVDAISDMIAAVRAGYEAGAARALAEGKRDMVAIIARHAAGTSTPDEALFIAHWTAAVQSGALDEA